MATTAKETEEEVKPTNKISDEKKSAPKVQAQIRPNRPGVAVTFDSGVPMPEMDTAVFSGAALAAEGVEPNAKGRPTGFVLWDNKMKELPHHPAGGSPSGKALYTVKAFSPDGVLVQLPFEEQIQNTAAGDLQDAIGLRRYQRKGFVLLIDFDTMKTVYCPAWGCFALGTDQYNNFCCAQHRAKTLPNMFNDSGVTAAGLMSEGVTTSRVWGS